MKKLIVTIASITMLAGCVTDLGTTKDGRSIKKVSIDVLPEFKKGQFLMGPSGAQRSIREQMRAGDEKLAQLADHRARVACDGDYQIVRFEDGKIIQTGGEVRGYFDAIVICEQ